MKLTLLNSILVILCFSCTESSIFKPYKTDHKNIDLAKRIFLTKYTEDNGDIVTSSWREVVLVKKNGDLYIIPKKDGAVYRQLVTFYFKNSLNIAVERIHFKNTPEDLEWLKEESN